jgi:hypothetical protein
MAAVTKSGRWNVFHSCKKTVSITAANSTHIYFPSLLKTGAKGNKLNEKMYKHAQV